MTFFKKAKEYVDEGFDLIAHVGKRLREQADRGERNVMKSFRFKRRPRW